MATLIDDEEGYLRTIDKLIDIGAALSSETIVDHLLDRILESAIEITNADGGTLYRLTEQKSLEFEIFINKSLDIHSGRKAGHRFTYPPIPLYLGDVENYTAIAATCALSKASVNIVNAYDAEEFDLSEAKVFDLKTGYHTQSVLAVPLINPQGCLLYTSPSPRD